MSVSITTVFSDILNAILSVVDGIAVFVQQNANTIATVAVIGAIAVGIILIVRRFGTQIMSSLGSFLGLGE